MAARRQKGPEENPFKPGYGTVPPCLAGRDVEQAALMRALRGLARKDSSLAGMVMYGPRGMGKTTLLGWLEREGAASMAIRVIRTTPARLLKPGNALADALLPAQARLSSVEASGGAKAPFVGHIEGKAKFDIADLRWEELEERLIAACRQEPRALLLDEAHVVTDENESLYREFLHVAQAVAEKSPFLLVLAGTPGLPDALGQLRATFIERAEPFGIGILDTAGAAEAIRAPMTADGFSIDDAVLDLAVQDGQRYPFFLQWWGKALWDIANESGDGRATLKEAQLAREVVDKARLHLYNGRYNEFFKNEPLTAAANAVAEAFIDRPELSMGEVRDAVKLSLTGICKPGEELNRRAQTLYEELHRLGYFWVPPETAAAIPGIPSLMDFTRAQFQGG